MQAEYFWDFIVVRLGITIPAGKNSGWQPEKFISKQLTTDEKQTILGGNILRGKWSIYDVLPRNWDVKMAYNFSANQFEDQYSPRKLGNWEHPKWYPDRPRQRFKSTKIIADDNGCLLEGVKKENPWGHYVGTWDLPRRITREYVNKLVAPPERLLKLWGKKKKEPDPEPELEKSEKEIEESGKEAEPTQEPEAPLPQEKVEMCTMCGKPLAECTCDRHSKSKPCDHSVEEETYHQTLRCPKCNEDMCFCGDTCPCPT